MSQPIVSIIIPTYNRADLLPRAIQSIGEPDGSQYEVVIVDDGSTDDTASVIASMARHDLRLIRNETNRGIGYSRAEGVRQARGEWIAFLDSDDLWLPGKLELQLGLFQNYPQLDLIFGNYLNRNLVEGTSQTGFMQTAAGLSRLQTRQLDETTYEVLSGLAKALLVSNFIGTSSVILRASVITKIGNFQEQLSGPEDFEFWWRAALSGVIFGYTQRPVSIREKGQSSISGDGARFLPKLVQAIEMCEQTAAARNHPELLPPLRAARARAWQGLIREQALAGNRNEAVRAFLHSIRAHFSMEAVKFVGAALAGPKFIHFMKNIGIH